MGESAVLAHSYSFAAPITRNDSHEDKTMQALSQSISFGKFVTENLEWGKWSTFSHRKYVEEAEKYSRPGSVAQKKAFFEAHYKRIAEAKKAATEEQPSITPAQALLQTLEETPPPPPPPLLHLTKQQQEVKEDEEEEDEERKRTSLQIGDELTDAGKEKEEDSCVGETRRSIGKNRPVFRLSLEKTIPPKATEMAPLSEKPSERPMTTTEMKEDDKLVHRQSFSLLNCFMGNAKSQDQNQSRKKRKIEKKKKKKQFLCLCLKPNTVRE